MFLDSNCFWRSVWKTWAHSNCLFHLSDEWNQRATNFIYRRYHIGNIGLLLITCTILLYSDKWPVRLCLLEYPILVKWMGCCLLHMKSWEILTSWAYHFFSLHQRHTRSRFFIFHCWTSMLSWGCTRAEGICVLKRSTYVEVVVFLDRAQGSFSYHSIWIKPIPVCSYPVLGPCHIFQPMDVWGGVIDCARGNGTIIPYGYGQFSSHSWALGLSLAKGLFSLRF